ncbi:MAG: hypothetical protein NC209_00355 [Alistipes sp.]|nr:hypothetical protein [Alistipes senegalensis]MCM1249583.1 hypothetical protein [Alistipes sp.]
MKRFFIAAAFVAALPAGAWAQVGKQVEVTKTYVPSLESAVKLPVRPDMTDTVKMYPEIDYSITPLSLETSFRTRPIRPASVTYWEFNRPRTFYVKAGAGYPLNSVVDFYASTQNAATGYVVGYLNHEGRYADIRNWFGDKWNSVRTSNRIGAAAGKYIGRHVLEGEIGYDNRLFHRYARHTPADAVFGGLPLPGSVVDYGDANLALRIGDDFQNLDRVNFEVAVHGGIFFDHSDRSDIASRARQNRLGGSAKIARAFGVHRFSLEAGYEWLDGSKGLAGCRQQQIHAAARYGRDGEITRLVVGADYYHDRVRGQENGNYVIPYVRVDFKLGAREFKPFVELDGEVRDNSFRSLARSNPYVVDAAWLGKSSVDYNVRLGLGGSLWSNRFDYRAYVAFSIRDHHVYWYGDYFVDRQNVWFSGSVTPVMSRQTVGSLHGEIIYRPISQLQFDLGLHGYLYNDEALLMHGRRSALSNGEPQFRGNAAIRYRGRKIAFGVSARAESRRLWTVFVSRNGAVSSDRFSVPFAIDLGVDFEWKISGCVSLFAEGRNLLDRRLYDYPWYPGYRAACTVGAKVSF